ncbi:MAG: MaoC family dehydratase [Butyrivibrio sp.]|nr:MaoC family dehydratase [Butyrivibrio sp.]
MNEYIFEELISKEEDKDNYTKAEFSVTVTSEMMEKFLDICGDNNPLHVDESFAIEKGFDGRVVYGMLTSTFYSTLAGVYLPGKNCILHGVETSFHAPVYIGDELTVSGFVKVKHEATKSMEISAKIVNQNGKKVGKAKILAGCLQ